ncbi:RNA 3'-terminal phosphate cyclase [Candidatus Woesearchaeota archaeon]|nr:MAG: RNA 3'-terminal phosphate cyclase [Candidatus Woesearchaeota archaeon]
MFCPSRPKLIYTAHSSSSLMLHIDGSHGEGGGAILRVALGLSVLTGKPFRITNIRSGRPKPGLKHEHLHCIRILQRVCDAKATDVALGSEEVTFIPGPVKSTRFTYDLETAASTTLVAHSIILATAFSGKNIQLTLRGGTDVKWSIPADYLANVLKPALIPVADVTVQTVRRGYYPRGGGELFVRVKGKAPGAPLAPLDFTERGKLMAIKGLAHATTELQDAEVAERIAHAAKSVLAPLGAPVALQCAYSTAASPGAHCVLWARFDKSGLLGASALGERGVRAETVGADAARELAALIESKAVIDEHLADLLVPFLGVCGGAFTTAAVTKHLTSNIAVTEQFLETTFSIDGCDIRASTHK